jgi:hypothetical protein
LTRPAREEVPDIVSDIRLRHEQGA